MSPIYYYFGNVDFFCIFSKFAIKNFQDVRHEPSNYFWGGFFCGVRENSGRSKRSQSDVREMLCMQMMLYTISSVSCITVVSKG